MNQQTAFKTFVFNEKIDKTFIFSLYDEDYECIAEVFSTTLSSFGEDAQAIEAAFTAGDKAGLRKAVHKMKPVLGFVGMLGFQEQFARFESLCEVAPSTAALAGPYQDLLQSLHDVRRILETESKRLTEFIS